MRIALLLGSSLGGLVWHDLHSRGLLAGVAIPVTAHQDQENLTAAVASAGTKPTRLHRATLTTDLTDWVTATQADVVLVLTFPWRVPVAVLALPSYGFLNYHFAPLPGYRGPEPLFWLLRNGEPAGAVTIHRMDADFDTGPIVVAEPVPLGPTDTFGWHRRQLTHAAVPATRKLLELLRHPAPLPVQAQDAAAARYWPRPTLPDVCIRWHEPATAIANQIRAANPWNQGAVATLRGQPIRVLLATPIATPERAPPAPPGTVLTATATELAVACGANTVLQLETISLGDDGFFTGGQLTTLGIAAGEAFGEIPPAMPAATIPG